MKLLTRGALVAALVLSFFSQVSEVSLWSQTVSGTLSGKVTDAQGHPVPGATVTVTGSAIQGTRTAVCDAAGRYTIPHLPPGEDYRVRVEAAGLASAIVENRAVRPETIVTQDFSLGASGTEVTVKGSAPALNLRQAVQPLQLPEKELKAIPLLGEFSDRSYQTVLYWSPSATHSRLAGNPAVSGATGTENIYQVDGLTTNDPVTGTWGTNLNVNFLKQVQGETAAFEASDASSTGGFFSLVTKSGSDQFHGDLFAWGITGGLTADFKSTPFAASGGSDYSALDWGAAVGGPIIKEKLWFFVGLNPYNKVERIRGANLAKNNLTGAAVELPVDYDNTTNTLGYFGKLTWRLNPEHLLELSLFGDPSRQDLHEGTKVSLYDTARSSHRTLGGTNAVLRWYATFRPDLFLDAHLGMTRLGNDLLPQPGSQEAYSTRAVVSLDWNQDFAVSPGFGRFTEDQRNTLQTGAKLTWLQGHGRAYHEVSAGFQYEKSTWNQFSDYTGGALVQVKRQVGPDLTNPDDYAFNYIYSIGNPRLKERGAYTALFAQDRVTLADTLTLAGGLRWERNALRSGGGNDFTLSSLSPRFSLAWDFLGNGRSKLFASAGRYYERVPLYLAQVLDTGHPTYKDVWNSGVLESQTTFSKNAAFGLPGVKNQSQDEYTLGVQWEPSPEFVLTARLLYRDLNRLLETVGYVNAAGGVDYIVMNPGDQTTPLLDTWAGRIPDYTAFPKPRRTFKALELMAEKRFSGRWFLQANYTLSRLTGNTAAGYDRATPELAPNATTEWDIPSAAWIANRDGLLPTDRTHQFKAVGGYDFGHGFLLSGTLRVDSGRPVNRIADWPKNEFGYGKLYVTPRGEAGRLPWAPILGLHAEYSLKMAKGKLMVYADVLNLFNTQVTFTVEEGYWNKRNTWGQPPVVNPSWGLTRKYNDPTRSVGIGVRWSF